jgi:hypothetical protein
MTDQKISIRKQQIEAAKWTRREAERAHDKLDEFHRYINEAAIKGSELAFRTSLLMNGGGAVSLLTFIGTLPKEQKAGIANTLVWFSSGVALAASAMTFAYFTSYFTAEATASKFRDFEYPYIKPGSKTSRYYAARKTFYILALLSGLASLGTFICGMLVARNAFTNL